MRTYYGVLSGIALCCTRPPSYFCCVGGVDLEQEAIMTDCRKQVNYAGCICAFEVAASLKTS